MTAQPGAQRRAVSSGRGDDRGAARGHPGPGGRPASRSFSTTSTACAPTTEWPACSSRKTVPRCPRRRAPCARRRRLRFPTETVKASTVLPDLDKYKGPALEYGRMEATASDPDVQQQFGMIVGKPNAGQVNALATLNIRGERSVTCRGDFDRHPSAGPLPPARPRVRDVPQAPGRPRARGRARRHVWAPSRSRDDADVWRRVLVQGPLRHEGHALHRRG